tara:strand:+ start:24887 stop:25516 length:630 start_codon:yes stop_codon:yes gene_type:complete
MNDSILILGNGGHAKIASEIISKNSYFKNIHYLDDSKEKTNFVQDSLLGELSLAFDNEICRKFKNAFVAIGNSQIRVQIINKLIKYGYNIPTLIHPTSCIAENSKIDYGCLINANVVVQPNVSVSYGSILNTSSTVDHDCKIGSGVHICPGVNIAGNVNVGNNAFIGIGSSVINNINIGENVMIGAGSVVINDLHDNARVYGNPAKSKL